MNPTKALELIEQVDFSNLVYYDGCYCGNCSIQGINIDLSCHKASGKAASAMFPRFWGPVLRVYTHSLDSDRDGMTRLAVATAAQVLRGCGSYYDAVAVRFAEFADDDQVRCVYCHKPRATPEDYLCQSCAGGESAEQHNFKDMDCIVHFNDETGAISVGDRHSYRADQ